MPVGASCSTPQGLAKPTHRAQAVIEALGKVTIDPASNDYRGATRVSNNTAELTGAIELLLRVLVGVTSRSATRRRIGVDIRGATPWSSMWTPTMS